MDDGIDMAKGMDAGICLYMIIGSGLAQASSAIQLYRIFVLTVRDMPDAATATAVTDCSGRMHKTSFNRLDCHGCVTVWDRVMAEGKILSLV